MVTTLRTSQSSHSPFVDAQTIVKVSFKNKEKQSYTFRTSTCSHLYTKRISNSLVLHFPHTHTHTHTSLLQVLSSTAPAVIALRKGYEYCGDVRRTLRRDSYCGLLGHDIVQSGSIHNTIIWPNVLHKCETSATHDTPHNFTEPKCSLSCSHPQSDESGPHPVSSR
jgi:hypothetical protein